MTRDKSSYTGGVQNTCGLLIKAGEFKEAFHGVNNSLAQEKITNLFHLLGTAR